MIACEKKKGMIKCTDFVFLFCQRSITFLCCNVGEISTYDDPVNGWFLAMLTYRHMTLVGLAYDRLNILLARNHQRL